MGGYQLRALRRSRRGAGQGALVALLVVAPDFFDQHVAPLLDERGAAGTATYDMFTAMALTESLHWLTLGGLLAQRGNGDSYDYRLALPNEGQDNRR